jgi:hypothetical protein
MFMLRGWQTTTNQLAHNHCALNELYQSVDPTATATASQPTHRLID